MRGSHFVRHLEIAPHLCHNMKFGLVLIWWIQLPKILWVQPSVASIRQEGQDGVDLFWIARVRRF